MDTKASLKILSQKIEDGTCFQETDLSHMQNVGHGQSYATIMTKEEKYESDMFQVRNVGISAVGNLKPRNLITASQSIEDFNHKAPAMQPFMWGAGKLSVQSILSALNDDEIIQGFIHAAPHRKIVFFEEIKRREIKTFVIDLDGGHMEDEIKRCMELCSDLVDDSVFADHSGIEMMLKEEFCMMERFQKNAVVLDSMHFTRKSNAHLFKMKESKFWQTLNKKRSRKTPR